MPIASTFSARARSCITAVRLSSPTITRPSRGISGCKVEQHTALQIDNCPAKLRSSGLLLSRMTAETPTRASCPQRDDSAKPSVEDQARDLFPSPRRADKLPVMDVMPDASGDTPGEARAGETAGGIATLAAGKLYALQHPYALDGRVSFYPASARGFSVANSYLLRQPDAAMLIDTGFGKDEPAIRAEIERLIEPGLPLSMFPLRLNEFMSINNVESFAGHFNVETCYTGNIDAALWFDFGAKAEGRDILKSMKVTAVGRAD